MKNIYITLFTICLSCPVIVYGGIFGASNFSECIIEEMPGTQNDQAANEVRRQCRMEHPDSSNTEKKSPIFGIKTSGECVLKYGKDVSSKRGAILISNACRKLYSLK